MKWTIEEENEAKEEYLKILDTLLKSGMKNEWVGEWEDSFKQSFGKKKQLVKGDKHKYMKYYLKNKEVLSDNNWYKITEDEDI